MSSRAIIRITPHNKNTLQINYARRMYAVIRRYTPEALEGDKNECFAELTGLRTFFKMSYQEIAEKILQDLACEIGVAFRAHVAKSTEYDSARALQKKSRSVSTFKEMNALFSGKMLANVNKQSRPRLVKRVKFPVPFLGKVK